VKRRDNQQERISHMDIQLSIKHIPLHKGFYIAGFVDGEGSFYIAARKRSDYSSGWKLSLHFNISQGEKPILEICKKYLSCGQIRESRPEFYTFEVSNRSQLKSSIIPFFTHFGFLSNKKKFEFSIFKKALALLEKGIHCQDDLKNFLDYRAKLNRYRKTRIIHTDEEIQNSFKYSNFVKESSETIR
jgi:hypothetical protein